MTHAEPDSRDVPIVVGDDANISWSGSAVHITSQIRLMCKSGQSTTNSRSSAFPSPRLCSLTNGRLSTPGTEPVDALRAFERSPSYCSGVSAVVVVSPSDDTHYEPHEQQASRLKRVRHRALRWGALKLAGVSGFRWSGFRRGGCLRRQGVR